MKRFLALLLSFILVVGSTLSLSGCSEKTVAILTKGEWTEKLAQALQLDQSENKEPVYSDVTSENPCFTAVQSCAEWDILDKTEKFEPDERASIDFAIETAVKAIGVEKIAKSSYGKTLQTKEDMIEFFHGVSDMDYISGGALYTEWADRVISDMNSVLSSLELEQYQDIGLTSQSVEVSAEDVQFFADGKTGKVLNSSVTVQKDSILVVSPSELYPEGKAAKIVSVEGEKFEYVTPAAEEVVDHVVLTGTYKPKVIGVMSMSDQVQVEKINGATAESQVVSPGSAYAGQLMYVPKKTEAGLLDSGGMSLDDIIFSIMDKSGKKGAASGSMSASVGLKNISVTTDIDMNFLTVKKAYARIDSTLSADFNASGKYSPETIPLAKVIVSIYGSVTLEFQATLTIGASGELSINWSLPTSIGVEYKKGASPKYISNAKEAKLTAEAHAEAYITPGIKGTFKVLGFSVASAGVYSGFNIALDAHSEVKRGASFYCLNIKGYVPLSCFVGGEGDDTLLAKLGAKKSWTIWDDKTSKVKKEWHIENNKIVPECTNPQDSEATPIPQEEYKKIEMPEFELPTFDDFSSSFFGITNSFITMNENTCDKFNFDTLPEGYSKKDIVCSSEDERIVSISNDGTLTANGAGVTRVKISTQDGKYTQYCTVRVVGDYHVDFTPLPTSTIAYMKIKRVGMC